MAGLQAPSLDPPSGAEPAARSIAIATSKTEFVDRPGPLRQSSAKQIGPSEIAGRPRLDLQPSHSLATRRYGADRRRNRFTQVRQRHRPRKWRRCDVRSRDTAPVAYRSQSACWRPQDPAPATDAPEIPRAAPRSPSCPGRPRPGRPIADEFAAGAPNTLDAAFLSPADDGNRRRQGRRASVQPSSRPRQSRACRLPEFAATNRSPGATATVIAMRAQPCQASRDQPGLFLRRPIGIRRHTQYQAALPDSAPAEQATSPTQHRPATVQPPLAAKLDPPPPTAASQDPGQPATVPPLKPRQPHRASPRPPPRVPRWTMPSLSRRRRRLSEPKPPQAARRCSRLVRRRHSPRRLPRRGQRPCLRPTRRSISGRRPWRILSPNRARHHSRRLAPRPERRPTMGRWPPRRQHRPDHSPLPKT